MAFKTPVYRRMLDFNLQYDCADIPRLAAEYMASPYKGHTAADEDREMEEAGGRMVAGADVRQSAERVYRWKSHRRMDLFIQNSDKEIAEAVADAVMAKTPRQAIMSLTRLKGVGVKMASAILTAMFPECYTVCDFRASEALGVGDRNDVGFYEIYLEACRRIAKECGVTLRDLDRANWRWSRNKGEVRKKPRCFTTKPVALPLAA